VDVGEVGEVGAVGKLNIADSVASGSSSPWMPLWRLMTCIAKHVGNVRQQGLSYGKKKKRCRESCERGRNKFDK
jgi:hypothetical protein